MLKIFKEAFSAIRKPYTIKYPAGSLEEKYSHLPKNLRGLLQFDDEKCIGCAACTVQCSTGANIFKDEEDHRLLEINLNKCVFCGRCVEICPEEALFFTNKFELASTVKDELKVNVRIELYKCENCGRIVAPKRQLNVIVERIMRNLTDEKARKIAEEDIPKYMYLCKDCRRRLSYKLNTHTRKQVLLE